MPLPTAVEGILWRGIITKPGLGRHIEEIKLDGPACVTRIDIGSVPGAGQKDSRPVGQDNTVQLWGQDALHPLEARFARLCGPQQQPRHGTTTVVCEDLVCARVAVSGTFQTLPLTLHGFTLAAACDAGTSAEKGPFSLDEALELLSEHGDSTVVTSVTASAESIDDTNPFKSAALKALHDAMLVYKNGSTGIRDLRAQSLSSSSSSQDGSTLRNLISTATEVANWVARQQFDVGNHQAPAMYHLGDIEAYQDMCLSWARYLAIVKVTEEHTERLQLLGCAGLAGLCILLALMPEVAASLVKQPAAHLILAIILNEPHVWPRSCVLHATAGLLSAIRHGGAASLLWCESFLGHWTPPGNGVEDLWVAMSKAPVEVLPETGSEATGLHGTTSIIPQVDGACGDRIVFYSDGPKSRSVQHQSSIGNKRQRSRGHRERKNGPPKDGWWQPEEERAMMASIPAIDDDDRWQPDQDFGSSSGAWNIAKEKTQGQQGQEHTRSERRSKGSHKRRREDRGRSKRERRADVSNEEEEMVPPDEHVPFRRATPSSEKESANAEEKELNRTGPLSDQPCRDPTPFDSRLSSEVFDGALSLPINESAKSGEAQLDECQSQGGGDKQSSGDDPPSDEEPSRKLEAEWKTVQQQGCEHVWRALASLEMRPQPPTLHRMLCTLLGVLGAASAAGTFQTCTAELAQLLCEAGELRQGAIQLALEACDALEQLAGSFLGDLCLQDERARLQILASRQTLVSLAVLLQCQSTIASLALDEDDPKTEEQLQRRVEMVSEKFLSALLRTCAGVRLLLDGDVRVLEHLLLHQPTVDTDDVGSSGSLTELEPLPCLVRAWAAVKCLMSRSSSASSPSSETASSLEEEEEEEDRCWRTLGIGIGWTDATALALLCGIATPNEGAKDLVDMLIKRLTSRCPYGGKAFLALISSDRCCEVLVRQGDRLEADLRSVLKHVLEVDGGRHDQASMPSGTEAVFQEIHHRLDILTRCVWVNNSPTRIDDDNNKQERDCRVVAGQIIACALVQSMVTELGSCTDPATDDFALKSHHAIAGLEVCLRCLGALLRRTPEFSGKRTLPGTSGLTREDMVAAVLNKGLHLPVILGRVLSLAAHAMQSCKGAERRLTLGHPGIDPGGLLRMQRKAVSVAESASVVALLSIGSLAMGDGPRAPSPALLLFMKGVLDLHAACCLDAASLIWLSGKEERGNGVLRVRANLTLCVREAVQQSVGPKIVHGVIFPEIPMLLNGLPPQLPQRSFTTLCLLADVFPPEWPPRQSKSSSLAPPDARDLRSNLAQGLERVSAPFLLLIQHALCSEARLHRAALGAMLSRAAGLGGGMGGFLARPILDSLQRALSSLKTCTGNKSTLSLAADLAAALHDAISILEFLTPLLHCPAFKVAALEAGIAGCLVQFLETLCEHQPRVTPALQADWGCMGNIILEALGPCLDESVRVDFSCSMLSAPPPEQCSVLAETLLAAHQCPWLDSDGRCRLVNLLLSSEQGRTGLRHALVHSHHKEIGSTLHGEIDTMSVGRAAKWAAGGGGGLFELGLSQENLQMLCLSLEQDSMKIAQAGRYTAVDLFVKAIDASLGSGPVREMNPCLTTTDVLGSSYIDVFWAGIRRRPWVSSSLSALAARQRFTKFSTESSKEMDALSLWEVNEKGLVNNPCLDVLRLATWAPRVLPTVPPPLSDVTAPPPEGSKDYTPGSGEHSPLSQVPEDPAGVENAKRASPVKGTKSLLSDPEQLVAIMKDPARLQQLLSHNPELLAAIKQKLGM